MTSHLVVKYDGEEMALSPDSSVDIEDKNPLFHDTELFSYPMALPLEQNRHVLGNLDDVNAERRAVELEHKRMDIITDSLPLRSGVASIQESEVIKDSLSMNIDERTLSFDDLIGDLKCQDVPLMDEIIVGEKIANVKVRATYGVEVVVGLGNGVYADTGMLKGNTVECTFEPQALGFSYPGMCAENSEGEATKKTVRTYPDGNEVTVPRVLLSYINVSDAYGENSGHWGRGGAKYCNARVCYKHHGLNDDGTTSDSVAEPTSKPLYEDHWPYWVLDADRPASGICFYVLYLLDCLFAYLDVEFDKSALLEVEDLKHLCFFTTHVHYDAEEVAGYPTFTTIDDVNKWLESRGCDGRLSMDDPEPKSIQEFKYDENHSGNWQTVKVGQNEVASIKTEVTSMNIKAFSAKILAMIANSDNFPDESVKTILDSLEASFGIRFDYDYERHKVTAYLLRDVLRSQEEPVTFNGTVRRMEKIAEKITGFRMKYSAESTPKEQEQYIRRQKRDYDTDFDYKEYPEGRVVLDKTYEDIATTTGANNTNVYVDLTTGDAFRFKVNKETGNDPRLFEVGQFKGIEVGDCSVEAEEDDTIREYVSDFQPMSFNDVNAYNRISANSTKQVDVEKDGKVYTFSNFKSGDQPMLVAYIDEDMEHEFVEHKINNPLSAILTDIYCSEVMKGIESYDPSDTDEGESPLQTYDWGLAVAMMRGGGTDMEIQRYDPGYDGCGNDKWRTVAGEYALTTDTMDAMGNVFDYNGTHEGIGEGERFSLKITGYRPFRYKYVDGNLKISTNPKEWGDPSWLVPCDSDVEDPQHRIQEKIRSRGLYDTFMSELAHFLLNRKLYKVYVDCTVAELMDFPNHWKRRWRFGDKVGYINKVNYDLSVEEALTEAVIEFYAL